MTIKNLYLSFESFFQSSLYSLKAFYRICDYLGTYPYFQRHCEASGNVFCIKSTEHARFYFIFFAIMFYCEFQSIFGVFY